MTFEDHVDTIGRTITSLHEENARLRASHAELLAAAKEARELIRIWPGMNIARDSEVAIWEAYQASPEMRRINAAIAKAEEHAT